MKAIIAWIVAVLLFSIWYGTNNEERNNNCAEKGGIVLKTPSSTVCAKVEVLP